MPGVTGWNKARLKRIIENKIYIGNSKFQQIIDENTYIEAQVTKGIRNTQKTVDRANIIYKIDSLTICPVCGTTVKRCYNSRKPEKTKWCCKNNQCNHVIICPDEIIKKLIFDKLNYIVDNPTVIDIPENKDYVPSIEVMRIENEINRSLDKIDFDEAFIRKNIFESASQKYSEIDDQEFNTQKLKEEFEKSTSLSDFSKDLLINTVKSIKIINTDGIHLILKNNKEIGDVANA